MNALIFLTIFLIVVDYFQIKYFFLSLRSPKVNKTELRDERILKLLKDKAGLTLEKISVIESPKMYGGMAGIQSKPTMHLSTSLLEQLDENELEYVLLHEAAHNKHNHPFIVIRAQLIIILLGIIVSQFITPIPTVILSLVLIIIFLIIARHVERVAENFAASHMDNPNAMITAVDKFERNWSTQRFSKLSKLISWNISYKEKREIARKCL